MTTWTSRRRSSISLSVGTSRSPRLGTRSGRSPQPAGHRQLMEPERFAIRTMFNTSRRSPPRTSERKYALFPGIRSPSTAGSPGSPLVQDQPRIQPGGSVPLGSASWCWVRLSVGHWRVVRVGSAGGAFAITGLAMIVLNKRFGSRTADGSAMLAQSKGFELYLSTAEADQIRFEEGIDVFSRYLPYAIVYGVADRWARVFQQLAAQGRYAADTSWYVGSSPIYSGSAFSDSMNSLSNTLSSMQSTVSASTPSPRVVGRVRRWRGRLGGGGAEAGRNPRGLPARVHLGGPARLVSSEASDALMLIRQFGDSFVVQAERVPRGLVLIHQPSRNSRGSSAPRQRCPRIQQVRSGVQGPVDPQLDVRGGQTERDPHRRSAKVGSSDCAPRPRPVGGARRSPPRRAWPGHRRAGRSPALRAMQAPSNSCHPKRSSLFSEATRLARAVPRVAGAGRVVEWVAQS